MPSVPEVAEQEVKEQEKKPRSKKESTVKKESAVKKEIETQEVEKETKKKKAPKKESERETVRVRALKALQKHGDMTAKEIQEAIGLGHGLKPTMDQEVERGHLAHAPHKDDSNTLVYRLTASGKKAIENHTVNPSREK